VRRWAEPVAADTDRFAPADVFGAGMRNHHISNTAYPIAHERTWSPYRVPRNRMNEVVEQAWSGIDDLCLYVHVPFCETRCSFCEYTVVGGNESHDTENYVQDLLTELGMYAERLGRRTLHGLDIGGGTPSFITTEQMTRVLELVRASLGFAPGADISIETTPRIAAHEPEKIAAYRAMGIDRISMGVQVIQPDLLRVLNREGNGIAEHRRAVDAIRTAGFERFNVDLMYGFAGQSIESWRATLQHAIDLAPEYITLYRMRYKLTRISHQAPSVMMDAVRSLAKLAKAMLEDAGYHANPGKTTYSRIAGDVGTSSYLARRVIQGMPYLGVGLGAQSFTHTTIGYNDGAAGKNLTPYRRSVREGRLPIQDLYDLPARQMMGKMCAVSFYFGEIDRTAFAAKFGVALEQAFPDEVAFVLERGLMTMTDRALSLTPEGAANVNGVIALFFAPSIQRYLIERDPDSASDMHRNRRLALKVAGEVAGV
jgi:oxygen-independent coproporphyrinogen III oxidase